MKQGAAFYEINGERKILPDWVAQYGANIFTVKSRLRFGWPLERALTEETR